MTERDPHHRIDLLEANLKPRVERLEEGDRERKGTINKLVLAVGVAMCLAFLKFIGPYL